MPVVPEEHHAELLHAALTADIAVLVTIDAKDVKVMFTETTDPRFAAHILRDIADGLDNNTATLRAQPVETFTDNGNGPTPGGAQQ